MVKDNDRFGQKLVAEYTYDPSSGRIDEKLFDPTFSTRAASPVSPVHAGVAPGSYAPAPSVGQVT